MIKIKVRPTLKYFLYYSLIKFMADERLEDMFLDEISINFDEHFEIDVEVCF